MAKAHKGRKQGSEAKCKRGAAAHQRKRGEGMQDAEAKQQDRSESTAQEHTRSGDDALGGRGGGKCEQCGDRDWCRRAALRGREPETDWAGESITYPER